MIEIFYVGCATCIINIDNCIKIGIDPSLSKKGSKLKFKSFISERKIEPKFVNNLFDNVDLWLLTHSHEDHLDKEGLSIISSNSKIICESKKTYDKINSISNDIKILNWNDIYLFDKENITVEITAIPAYHAQNFVVSKVVGKVNGYIITISSNKIKKSIYITGDTIFNEKIIKNINTHIDIMIANLGNARSNTLFGPLTMNIDMLEKFVKKLTPDIVIPVHIDDYSHYNMTKSQVEKAGYKIIEQGKWIKVY